MQKGEKAEVLELFPRGKGIISHLRDMGLLPGKVIEILNNQGYGPVLLKVDETRIAIGRGIAMKIFVRRLNNETERA